jgi:hypothetical protein
LAFLCVLRTVHCAQCTACCALCAACTACYPLSQGALIKKVTDLDVVGWFLGGQKSTRAGQFFWEIFLSWF